MKNAFSRALAILAAVAGTLLGSLSLQAQGKVTVSGTVLEESGEPVIGLTVLVKGSSTGTETDIDGHYSISAPSDGTLVYSCIGYVTQEVKVAGRNVIVVTVKTDSELLSDAVVIGYGTTAKKDLTGSVATMKTKDFNAGLISTPEQLINGKVSGVQIMSSSGSPTSGSTIRIRGGASLNASNDPQIGRAHV